MLEVHLNPDTEKASRKPEFMDASVTWICNQISPKSKVLDLGCGPGLYVERIAKYGHICKGIDFSKSSIDYAKENTANPETEYTEGDYLTAHFGSDYDLVILLSCDFGVFSFEEQGFLLDKIFACLKEGGLFIFDAFTRKFFDEFKEEYQKSEESGGFWSPNDYILIKECFKYEDETVTLGQYHLIEEGGTQLFRIWSKCYLETELLELVQKHGFESEGIFSDVCGNPMNEDSETIGIICRKSY
ncbi:class I SAM-dependent methyltransferase [Crocinitomix catalasitica]|nr:class I SAM-dependent methyltransferase [Crocinitomix catalasitica]